MVLFLLILLCARQLLEKKKGDKLSTRKKTGKTTKSPLFRSGSCCHQIQGQKWCLEMYKAFLLSTMNSPKEKNAIGDDGTPVDPNIKDQVDRVWKEIEPQCDLQNEAQTSTKIDDDGQKLSDWKIVRLFVSSTFADFFNEREVLVKKVFPELREWCRDKHLKLIECDLRWGVPRDTPSEQTISICLEEIDKCIKVSDGFPLFIGLLGDRYGWIPSKSDISSNVRDEYKWVDGTSITCMEILHGAYRARNPNAAFFMRNSSVYSDIPQSHISYFVDKDPLASHQLKVMKEKLSAALPNQIYHYEPKFKQLSNGESGKESHHVELEGYEDFAKNALDFLKSSISRIHPNQKCDDIDPLQQEQRTQWLYILDKANSFIGRKKEKYMLMSYLREGKVQDFERTVSVNSQIRQMSDWDVSDSDQPLCVVEAPGGWGKTTLISSIIKDFVEAQKDWKVVYHMVGSTPNSIQEEWLIRQILSAVITDPSKEDKSVIEEGSLENKTALLRKALVEFRERQSEKLIIILDNLNGLLASNTVNHLSWLPPLFPSNMRVLVSTTQHLPTKSRLYEHPTLRMILEKMTQKELSDIVIEYLGNFSKKLHPSQLTSLMTRTGVDNPLWLTMMAEELRIFGSFAEMDQRIARMPTSLDKFLVQVFGRLVKEDHTNNLVKKALCLIACSRYGLPTEHVLQIFGDAKTKEPIALLDWLQVKRALSPYLRMSGFLEEMITFSHDAVSEAVREHFLSERAEVCHWHTVLADYYQYCCSHTRTKVWHLPYHLRKAQLKQRMVQFIRTDKMSAISMAPFLRSDFLKDCRCRLLADPVIPGIAPLMLCPSCTMKNSAGFNSKCFICNAHCINQKGKQAYACFKHSGIRGKDSVKCASCNFVVSVKDAKESKNLRSSHALLCQWCSMGNGDRTCAVLSCDKPWMI